MPLYKKLKSPLGYQMFQNQIDSYGVDHSGFSTRDELEYQFARDEKENELMAKEDSIGLNGSYTQYGTNFWGRSSENNYGFGNSNISENIKDLKKTNTSNPISQIFGAIMDMGSEYFKMKEHNYIGLDDYHHCKANYNASDRGLYGAKTAKLLGDIKEDIDFYRNIWNKGLSKEEALKDKMHDKKVNEVGILKGLSGAYKNAKDACADYRPKDLNKFPKKYW